MCCCCCCCCTHTHTHTHTHTQWRTHLHIYTFFLFFYFLFFLISFFFILSFIVCGSSGASLPLPFLNFFFNSFINAQTQLCKHTHTHSHTHTNKITQRPFIHSHKNAYKHNKHGTFSPTFTDTNTNNLTQTKHTQTFKHIHFFFYAFNFSFINFIWAGHWGHHFPSPLSLIFSFSFPYFSFFSAF